MATYYLYKNEKIINIIEAEESFIKELESRGEIDKGIDVSTLENPKSLCFDEKTQSFKPTKPSTPLKIPSNHKEVNVSEMKEQVEILSDKLSKLESETEIKTNDLGGAILAIKGFMMILPDIQNSLREIKDMLESKQN